MKTNTQQGELKMSEELHNQDESQEVNEEQKPTEEQVDVQALLKRVEQLEASKERILEESKQYKNKYRELRNNVETEQKQKLEESENWKELLDIEKNRAHTLNEELASTKKRVLKKELNFQVARYASDAFDVDDVINSLPKDMIEIDQESLSVKGVDTAVSFLKEKKPYLFNTGKKPGMASSRPVSDNGKKDLSQLSKQEQEIEFMKAMENEWFSD